MDRTERLKHIFAPKSIAVIGASTQRGKVGHDIFFNILMGGYTGILYPVNPKAPGILGVRAYTSVLDIPDPVDLAVVITPSKAVPGVIEECGKKGVKGMVVITAGFKEIGSEGAALEREVVAGVRRHDIALVGPNCLGVINTDAEVSLNASFARTMPKRGSIAFMSQSGALCTAVLDYAKGKNIGFSKFISFGNKADITENDILEYLGADLKTRVILMYIEDLVNGRQTIQLAQAISGEIAKPKPILAVKAGRTAAGAKAASSHTGSLAGSDELYSAVLTQCGILRVETVEELFDYAIAFASQPLPRGRDVAIVTNAGGPGIMATDACIRSGLALAELSGDTKASLIRSLPPTANVNNPVDVIGDAQHDRYEAALSAVLKDRQVNGGIVILTPQSMTDIDEIARTVARIAGRHRKPVLASFMGIVDVSSGIDILEEHGVPHYGFPESAARAYAAMLRYKDWVVRPRTKFREYRVHRDRVEAIIETAQKAGQTYLNELESLKVLEAYGFPLLKHDLAENEDDVVRVASRIGYPVAIKIASPDIVHKVDVGGVRLNVSGAEDARRAFREMMETVRQRVPQARLLGVNVEEMAKKGIETIMGIKRDPQFGPVLMFGLGGIYVEAYRDVVFRVAPIRLLSAQKMITSIRAFPVLKGMRGEKQADLKRLIDCLLRLSQLACDFPEIAELDINPLIVYEERKGARVADVRIILDFAVGESGVAPAKPHAEKAAPAPAQTTTAP